MTNVARKALFCDTASCGPPKMAARTARFPLPTHELTRKPCTSRTPKQGMLHNDLEMCESVRCSLVQVREATDSRL